MKTYKTLEECRELLNLLHSSCSYYVAFLENVNIIYTCDTDENQVVKMSFNEIAEYMLFNSGKYQFVDNY